MNGVKFGNKHSITDWDLLMTARNIGDAEPCENYISIPGADGEKDLTEAFGEVKYKPRTLSPSFDMFHKPSDWLKLKDKITNYLHGKKMKVTYDTEPDYYFIGRCKVSNFSNDYTVGHITIEVYCSDPFKYKLNPTVVTNEVAEGNTYTYTNDRKTVVPKLTLSAAMQLEFNGNTYSFNAGTHTNLSIEFVEGENEIKVVSGSGTLTVEYQEARL